MKKITITLLIIFTSIISANACEICGCGLGNYYVGMMPQFNRAFFGIRYQFRNFHTVIADNPDEFSRDHYKTIELWGGWNIGKKWQVIAILPYNYIHQVTDDGVKNNQGIGDIAAMVNYKLFSKISRLKNNKLISQQLWAGVGIKIPTGKFNIDATDPELVSVANTQTGSASTDFLLNTMYNIRINRIGVNTTASYKLNTTNKDDYTFGNKFSANSTAYYTIQKRYTGFIPNVGMIYENTASNTLQKQKVAQTGGYLLAASAGIEVSYKKISVGMNMQLPVSQDFSNGQTDMKIKGMMHVSFSL